MAITRTPIHDDDGSGTTGTIIDNAWKQEFYGQIDAADTAILNAAAAAGTTVLRKGTGHYAVAAAANLDTVVIPALLVPDTLRVGVTVQQAGAAGVSLSLTAIGDVSLIRLDDIAGGSLGVSGRGTFDVTIRMDPSYPLAMDVLAVGGVGVSGSRLTVPIATTSNWTNGGWTLGLSSGGQAAGGSIYWSWSVTKA